MTEKYLYLSQPKEGFTYPVHQGTTFTYKLPILSNDRVPHMEVELIQAYFSSKNQAYREGLEVKLLTTASNYISQDNKGIHLGFFEPETSQTNWEMYSLQQNQNPMKLVMSTYETEWVIKLLFPNGADPDDTQLSEIQHASFLFKLTFPEPNEITNQYSREIAKVRL